MTRELLLVNELTGEDQHGKHQRQRPNGSRPGVGTAEEKVRREKSTEEENHRRDNEPDYVMGNGMPPARMGLDWA